MREEWFCRKAPLIYGSVGTLLGLVGYLVDKYGVLADMNLWLIVIAMQAFFGFRCGELVQKLHKSAYTDSLTKLGNRRMFYHRLDRVIAKQRCKDAGLFIAFIDVDFFKYVNDNYGHRIGDEILIMVGHILRKNARASDTVIRWGGDEFAIIFSGTDIEGVHKAGERIRMNVASALQEYQVTISVGIISVQEGDNSDKVLIKADKALYQAKKTRNMVVMADAV